MTSGPVASASWQLQACCKDRRDRINRINSCGHWAAYGLSTARLFGTQSFDMLLMKFRLAVVILLIMLM